MEKKGGKKDEAQIASLSQSNLKSHNWAVSQQVGVNKTAVKPVDFWLNIQR